MSWIKEAITSIKPKHIPNTEDCLREFIQEHGKNCCASCDHWYYHNSVVGECHKSAPVSGYERLGVLGININASLRVQAGHPFTPREHVCGEWVLMTEDEVVE